MDAKVRCKNGSFRHIEFHFATLGDTDLVSFVDLTDRENAQTKLQESEERLRGIANADAVLNWLSGPDRSCKYFNRRCLIFNSRIRAADGGTGSAEVPHRVGLD